MRHRQARTSSHAHAHAHAHTHTHTHTRTHAHAHTRPSRLRVLLCSPALTSPRRGRSVQVREEATLQCRISFARLMIRHELLAELLAASRLAELLRMQVHVGERKGDSFTFNFRSVVESVGSASMGVDCNDPFAKGEVSGTGGLARLQAKVDDLVADTDTRTTAIMAALEVLLAREFELVCTEQSADELTDDPSSGLSERLRLVRQQLIQPTREQNSAEQHVQRARATYNGGRTASVVMAALFASRTSRLTGRSSRTSRSERVSKATPNALPKLTPVSPPAL